MTTKIEDMLRTFLQITPQLANTLLANVNSNNQVIFEKIIDILDKSCEKDEDIFDLELKLLEVTSHLIGSLAHV